MPHKLAAFLLVAVLGTFAAPAMADASGMEAACQAELAAARARIAELEAASASAQAELAAARARIAGLEAAAEEGTVAATPPDAANGADRSR